MDRPVIAAAFAERLIEQLDRLVSDRLYEHTQRMAISSVALAALFWRLMSENAIDAEERSRHPHTNDA